MTDEQIRAIWREMRPMQGDPDPIAFGRRLLEQHRDDLRMALAAAIGWPGGISAKPPALDLLPQEVAARRGTAGAPVIWGLQRPDGTIDDQLCSTDRSDCEFWSRAESEHQSGWPIVALGVIEESA